MSEQSCEDFLMGETVDMQKIMEDDRSKYMIVNYGDPPVDLTIIDFTGVGLFLTVLWSDELYNEFRINDTVITNTANNKRMILTDFFKHICHKRKKKRLLLSFEIRLTNPSYDSEVKISDNIPYHPYDVGGFGEIGEKGYPVNFIRIDPSNYVYFRTLIILDRDTWYFVDYSHGVSLDKQYDTFDEQMNADDRKEKRKPVFLVLNPNSGNYYPINSSKGTKYVLEGTKILKKKDEQGFRDWDLLLKYVPLNKVCYSVGVRTRSFLNFIRGTYFSPLNPEWGEESRVEIYKKDYVIDLRGPKIEIISDKEIGPFMKNIKDIGIVYMNWKYKDIGHSTLLIFDRKDMIVYHMDPNGEDKGMGKKIVHGLFSKSKYKVGNLFKSFKYGPQGKQGSGPFPNFTGSCGTWTKYFVSMILLNPDKTIIELIHYIMGKSSGQMTNQMRRFSEFSHRVIGSPNTVDDNEVKEVNEGEWRRKMSTLRSG